MGMTSKTGKTLAWILSGVAVAATAAFGAHIYVTHTIDDAMAFLERQYDLEDLTYSSYSFDPIKQALVLHDVVGKTQRASVSDDQDSPIEITFKAKEIVYQKCDFKSITPRYCEGAIKSISVLDQNGESLFKDLSASLGADSQTEHLFNLYVNHHINDNEVMESKVALEIEKVFEYQIEITASDIDWDSIAKRNAEWRTQMKAGELSSDQTKAILKENMAIAKTAKLHRMSIAFKDYAGLLQKASLGNYKMLFPGSTVYDEFVKAPKQVKAAFNYKGGFGLETITTGQFNPTELHLRIDLNDKEFTEGAAMAQASLSQMLTPENVALYGSLIDQSLSKF